MLFFMPISLICYGFNFNSTILIEFDDNYRTIIFKRRTVQCPLGRIGTQICGMVQFKRFFFRF